MMATGVAVRGCCRLMRLQNGWTAVMVAAQNGHESTVRLLLDRGADMEAHDEVSGGVVDPCPRRRSGVAVSATGWVCSCGWRWTGAGSGRPAALVGRCGLRAVCEAACPPRVWGGGRGGGHGGGTGCRGVWWCVGSGGGRGWRARAALLRVQGVARCADVCVAGWLAGARVAAVADGGAWGAAAGAMAGGRDEARGCGRRRVVCVLGIVCWMAGALAVCGTGLCVGGGRAVVRRP